MPKKKKTEPLFLTPKELLTMLKEDQKTHPSEETAEALNAVQRAMKATPKHDHIVRLIQTVNEEPLYWWQVPQRLAEIEEAYG